MHRKAPISLLSLSLLFSPVLASSGEGAVCNANHIFNAIHSSMRQWGGSLNHNGMSLFLATVPEGTQLYHGTSDPDFIKGMQWLAFEPEHALIFAHPRGGRGPGGPPPGDGPPPMDEKEPGAEDTSHVREYWHHHGPPPEYGHGPEREHKHRPPPPHHDEHHDRPDFRPPHDDKDHEHHRPPPPHDKDHEHHRPPPPHDDEDHEHHRPPPFHEHRPCNGTERRPPPRDHERGPGKHREHGPPPPLPPGHVYKPYPPPPRKERPPNGPSRPWSPEHHHPPPPGHHDGSPEHHGPPPPEHYDHHEIPEPIELRSESKLPHHLPWKRQAQQPLRDPLPSPQEQRTGYLHTYVPTHALHLLYIDGLSAGKTSNGTLDTQDRLLLNLTNDDAGGPMGGEMARARGLCELASTVWQGRVDGVIRLEGGFEIILCDFEKHLERVDVVAVGGDNGDGDRRGPMGGWAYTKAVASRYHGIGGGRVVVDYERFVSAFAYEGVKGLWDNDVVSDVRMPRLTNVGATDLQRIKDDVTALVLAKDWDAHPGRDWQAVADMLVTRYSAPLHHMATTKAFREDKEQLASYLGGLLRPFIDAGSRNASLETARCVAQLVPPLPSLSIPPARLTPLAHRALHTVAARICDTLLTSLSIASSLTPHSSFSPVYAEHAVEVVRELLEWLNWTSWKECGRCGDDEVCFIPIWPTGTLEDHAKPRCRGAREIEGRTGYWGLRMRGPPGGKPPGEGRKGGRWWKMDK